MEKFDHPNTIRELMGSIDENGELPLLKRYWLVELLQRNNDQVIDPWLALESISAHKVQDIWKQYFASEQFPIEVLSIADSLIISGGDTSHMEKLLAECKTALDNKFLLGEDYFRGVYAGFAMWAAARNVAYAIRSTMKPPLRWILNQRNGMRVFLPQWLGLGALCGTEKSRIRTSEENFELGLSTRRCLQHFRLPNKPAGGL